MSESDLAALAADVRYLKDRADILDCMNRYTRGADRLDRALLLSAYHPDATDDRGAFTGGPEARVDWLLAYLGTLDHTSHHIWLPRQSLIWSLYLAVHQLPYPQIYKV